MNQLKVVSIDGQLVTDSRDVASMTDKRHSDLIRDIENYKSILDQNADLRSDDFFTSSQYTAGTGKKYKCFLLTKIGCDMVANKMTGEKGILFTATYTKRFEQMEKEIQEQSKPSYMIDDPIKRAEKWISEQKETKLLKQENEELKPKATYYDLVLQNKSLLAISKIAKDYGMSGTAMNKLLHELGIQYKQGDTWLLYQKYANEAYTHSKTQEYDGGSKSKLHTYWTQKGRLFIYRLLKDKKEIFPTIEQENEQLRMVE